jgi:predicted small lipoprotein YifL
MRWPVLIAILVLAACGGSPKGPHAQVPRNASVDQDPDTGDELICKDERMTGTNVSRSVCRTQAEIDAERDAAMTWEKRPRNDTGH